MVIYTCNLKPQEDCWEFEASLRYKVNSSKPVLLQVLSLKIKK